MMHLNPQTQAPFNQALALDTLKDLFVNQLLPNRKLRYFHEIASASHSTGDEADKESVFWSAPRFPAPKISRPSLR